MTSSATEQALILKQPIVKAARMLLDWTQGDLADHADVSNATIARFEAGASMRLETMATVVRVFEENGIHFIFDDAQRHVIGVYLSQKSKKRKSPRR